uniref:45W antigen ToW4 n=1 Tax=Taenia ovis TaxID=6203 RepID=Q94809_TAEOV|nr:45W antigen ToW4 [Taenia ovis]
MASQLHLILLVTSLLALDYKESIRTLAVRLPALGTFQWGPLFSDRIGLGWDPEEFDAFQGDLMITAVATSGSKSQVTDGANLNEGSVTLMGLTPNSSYVVTVTANLGENTTLVLRKTIHTPANGTEPPPIYFYWGPVTNESIRLSWDQLDLEDISNAIITLTAEMASNPRVEHSESARIGVGEVTVYGLKPGTLYIMTATALIDGQQFFNSTRDIRTLDTGHGEVTVVTTSGSGIASAILGLLLTCMALVLA